MTTSKASKSSQPEHDAGAWARFERAVDVVAKSPPQHRAKGKKSPNKKKTKSKQVK
jgi:hypothetical protein